MRRRTGHVGLRAARAGAGLIELLIALAISASLLTAAAVALDASLKSYQANQEQTSLMQQGRVAMNRMVTLIRTSDAHSPDDPNLADNFASGTLITTKGIAMFDEGGHNIVFRYDAAKKLLLVVVDSKEHELCQGVEDFKVEMEPMRSPTSVRLDGSYDLLKRATIFLKIRTTEKTAMSGESTGKQTVALSAAVVPRRNVW